MAMKSSQTTTIEDKVPRRPYGSRFGSNSRLPSDVPILGLGCSSFSHFFWTPEELTAAGGLGAWTPETMDKSHPRAKEWIETIRYAVEDCGITLLDTAPWYGHGTSEVVIGWAMDEILHGKNSKLKRSDLIINTKVGRYQADPEKMFDFSRETTVKSVERSLARMKCDYIDVLQLHDPEFAPSIDILLKETIPALLECRQKGYCKALGMTGFPLVTQYQIMQRSEDLLLHTDSIIWDQSLTYGQFNLVHTDLITRSVPYTTANSDTDTNDDNDKGDVKQYGSFAEYCEAYDIGLLAAAPLYMGLLTNNTLPEWHPASDELKEACQKAAADCKEAGINIVTLAIIFALSSPTKIPCTIVGMKDVAEVKASHALAIRFQTIDTTDADKTASSLTIQQDILQQVLTKEEYQALEKLQDPVDGPFAAVWKNGQYVWDGILEATNFWKQVEGQEQAAWHWK